MAATIPAPGATGPGQSEGPRLLRNLKENGNYLTPGGGINTMSLVAVVLRGVDPQPAVLDPAGQRAAGPASCGARLRSGARGRARASCRVFVLAAIVYSLATGRAQPGAAPRLQGASLDRALGGRAHQGRAGRGAVASIDLVLRPAGRRRQGRTGPDGDGPVVELRRPDRAAWSPTSAPCAAWPSTVHKLPGMTTDLIAMLAAALIIYGVLVFCHGLAVIFDR